VSDLERNIYSKLFRRIPLINPEPNLSESKGNA